MFFFRGDLAVGAFVIAALFLVAFLLVLRRQPKQRTASWPLGVASAAWVAYGMWESSLIGGAYLRLDLLYLWPLLLVVSVFAIVWAQPDDSDGAE